MIKLIDCFCVAMLLSLAVADAAAIGLINLIYNLARYEQIVRLKLLPRNAA